MGCPQCKEKARERFSRRHADAALPLPTHLRDPVVAHAQLKIRSQTEHANELHVLGSAATWTRNLWCGRSAPSDEVESLRSGSHRRELTAPGGQAALALASECAPTALGFSGRASQNSFNQRNQGGRSQMSISNGAHTHASTSPRPRNGCAVPPSGKAALPAVPEAVVVVSWYREKWYLRA